MMDESPHQPIGKQLRQFRLTAGLSQEALAESSGISVRTISDLERGQRPGAHPETVRLLANALGLSDDDRRQLLEAARAVAPPEVEITSGMTPSRIGSAKWKDSLPSPAAPLVGREDEIDQLVSLLGAKTGQIVTLTGPGGVGKTSLAIASARQSASSFADGVAFVDLSTITQATLAPDAIAQVLGMTLRTDSIADWLTALLETRELLLVLDNFEHIIDAAPFAARLNADCPQLSIMVTSRVRLHVSHEREVAVPPLDVATHGEPLDRIHASAAIRLFAERAAAADPTFELSDRNAGAVAEICRRLDGLPLAIELAASRLRVLPVELLLDRLEHRLPLLTGGHRDLPQRQHSMRETIAWSYDLLQPSEQQFLRWASVFVGGFSLESAETLGHRMGLDAFEALEVLTTLIESALIQGVKSPDGQPRFQMFETIREFGLEHLALTNELAAARFLHATHFLEFAQLDAPRPDEPIRDVWLATISGERHNLVSAFDFLCQPETAELCLPFAAAMGPYWHIKGPFSEALPRLRRAIELAPLGPSTRKVHILCWMSLLLGDALDVQEGLVTANACVAMAQQAGTPSDQAAAIQALAWVEGYRRDWATCGELLERALGLWIALDNDYMQAECLALHGGIEYADGNLERANAEAERASEIFLRMGDIGWSAATMWYQGMFAMAAGRMDIAAEMYERSLRHWLQSDSSSRWFKPLVGLADVAATLGAHVRSARLLGASDELLRTTGMMLTPFDEPGYARAVAASRQGLGDAEFEAHRLAGSRLTTHDWLADSSAIVEAARLFSTATTARSG